MTTESTEEFDALEFFKSEIRSEDLCVRVDCITNLDVIAHALGPAMALSSLVPLISECVKGVFGTDDDEVLLAFAKFIPKLVPYLPEVSGSTSLVPILESLAGQDETVIREAAVKSLGKLADTSAAVCFQALIRLFKAEWFSLKLSGCGLAHFVYPHVTEENKGQIRALYVACANDETPMVRRSAAFHMQEMIRVVEKQFVISELVPVYRNFAQDDTQEAVRVSCVSASLSLCERLDANEIKEFVRETVASLATDKSWRVRLAVVKVYGELCRSCTVSHMVEPLAELMRDQEPDVRKAAVMAFRDSADLLNMKTVMSVFVPLFGLMMKDPVYQVRAALSGCVGSFSKSLGKEFTTNNLIPLLMEAVKDEHASIRYKAVGSIGTICETVEGESTVTANMIALLHSLSEDVNWRTRLAVLEQIPVLCRLLGKEVFEAKLESLFLSFFGDSVHAVREALTRQIELLVTELGEEWTVHHFTPKVTGLYSDTNSFSSRIAILHTLPKLAHVISNVQEMETRILSTLELGYKDQVANVRFVACAVAKDLIALPVVEKSRMLTLVRPLLQDDDLDVRFFAAQAIQV